MLRNNLFVTVLEQPLAFLWNVVVTEKAIATPGRDRSGDSIAHLETLARMVANRFVCI